MPDIEADKPQPVAISEFRLLKDPGAETLTCHPNKILLLVQPLPVQIKQVDPEMLKSKPTPDI